MIGSATGKRHDRSGRMRLGQVPMIWMYHGVAEVASDPNSLFVTPARFARQMAWLERRGLRGVSAAALVEAMRAGRHRGLVGITFDDGYACLLEAALPELARRGFTATFFIIAGLIGGTNEWDDGPSWPLLSASGVGELAAAGMEIGSHSSTHTRLAGMKPDQLAAEVGSSRAALASLTGGRISGFAYPYGSMDAAATQAVRDAGYAYACAVETPLASLGMAALPRVYIGEADGAVRLAVKRRLHKGYITAKGGLS
jgi:peptidoglycan/xylan/chitin deacetylase (PgdA/CDA1 family)